MAAKKVVGKEPKEEKKKLIVVEDRNDGKGTYTGDGMRFAFLAKPENGRRIQATGFISCRDGVNGTIRAHVHGTASNSTYTSGRDRPIDMDNLRLLMVKNSKTDKNKVDTEIRDKIFSGKAAINLYEGLAGWKKSKITTVNHSSYGKQAWLLTGPGNWMKAPSLVSMATLIMRVASWHGPLKADDLDQLNKTWKMLANKKDGYDISYIRECWEKFELIIMHADEIFSDPINKSWPTSFPSGSGGIRALCRFETGITKVDERFKKICNEHLRK